MILAVVIIVPAVVIRFTKRHHSCSSHKEHGPAPKTGNLEYTWNQRFPKAGQRDMHNTLQYLQSHNCPLNSIAAPAPWGWIAIRHWWLRSLGHRSLQHPRGIAFISTSRATISGSAFYLLWSWFVFISNSDTKANM